MRIFFKEITGRLIHNSQFVSMSHKILLFRGVLATYPQITIKITDRPAQILKKTRRLHFERAFVPCLFTRRVSIARGDTGRLTGQE